MISPEQIALILGCGFIIFLAYYAITWMEAMRKNGKEQIELLKKLLDKEK